MKCILHVGPPKTGSTTIQTFLRQNRKALLRQGILGLAEHQLPKKLPFFFRKPPRLTPWARRKRLDQEKEMEALRTDTHRYIQTQVRKHKPDILVLSSEGMARPSQKVRRYFLEIASELEIVYFLRRPDFRDLSSYKNNLRNKGYTGSIKTEYLKKLDDGTTLGKLANCFGRDNIIPVICRDSHPDRDAADGHIEALLKILFGEGNASPDDFILPGRKNIAWDYRALYYMREFNRIAQHQPELETHRLQIARLLQEHFSGGEKLRLPRSLAEGIVANYQTGWEDIRKQYFPEQAALFHDDFSMYSEDTSAQTFGAEEAVQVSLTLLQNFLGDNHDR